MPLDLNSLKSQASDLAGKAGDVAGSVSNKASDLAGQAGDYLQSDDFKKILPYILSGGTGAVLGGVMTGKRRARSGEGRMGHLRRILTNALIGGGLAGGSHYLLNKGIDKARGATADGIDIPDERPASPLENTTKSVAFSPLTAVGAGAAGLAATDKHSLIGADRAGQSRAARVLAGKLGLSVDNLMEMSPDKFVTDPHKVLADGQVLLQGDGLKLRQRAGIGAGEGVRGLLSSISRKGPLSTLGQTWPRRAFRGGVGLAAAGIPALLGAYLTSDKSE